MNDKDAGGGNVTPSACELPSVWTTSKEITDILHRSKRIAMVGLSPKEERASNSVAKYLISNGYEVIPVNPAYSEILGLKSYPSVSSILQPVDIVDIFRKLDAIPGIVDEAIVTSAKVVWMQENLVHNPSAEKAKSAGLAVVMDRCIMKEHHAMLGKKDD